ncbi:MAG: hypothetical protein HXS48_13460 [Theionarchaea archaeon]|nr:MAG: hypothetical protein AYK19_05305 [Theionarchaea archaeon DG-70-1]MBU7027937.1 hypothetical protein [Theionarchaea archaeon]
MYPTQRQFEFWLKRREGKKNIEIAREYNISKQAVGKALQAADKKILKILIEMAQANRIEIRHIDEEKGLLYGRSSQLKKNAAIFLSKAHGIQVWYEHTGDCTRCEHIKKCTEVLSELAGELGISMTIENPSKDAEKIFEVMK